MIYFINVCDKCGSIYRMANNNDRFCPFCGTEVKLPFGGADTEELNKEIQAGKREITRLKNELEMAAIKKDNRLMAENKQLTLENRELTKKLGTLERVAAEEEAREKLEVKGKQNNEIFIQFINLADKKSNPLPAAFKRRYLDLSGKYILDGERGKDTSVYLCGVSGKTAEIYPNEMILSPLMRDYYLPLFDIANKFGKDMTAFTPAVVETANSGYYKLVSKGKIVFE